MIAEAVSAGTILLYFGGLWWFAARHDFWDRRAEEQPIRVPDLIDYVVYPDDVGGLT